MYFHFSTRVNLLLPGVTASTLGPFACALLFLFCIALAREKLAAHRLWILRTSVGSSTVSKSLLYGVMYALDMYLMLLFMSLNIWVCLAIVLGVSAGNFYFHDFTQVASPAENISTCC